MSYYKKIGTEIGALVDRKQKAYGNSFGSSENFLKILYPDGIAPSDYPNLLLIIRMFDKLKRLATNNDPYGESPYRDLAGYALLGVAQGEEDGKEEASEPKA